MPGTYTYEPSEITCYGKDRMRFELGDVMVDGKERTCAMSDEEYLMLTSGADTEKKWKKAKLKCLESIFHRFAYEPDTKVGPTTLGFNERAKLWRDEYARLKAEVKKEGVSPSAILMNIGGIHSVNTPPYFYNGMMSTEESEGKDI